MCSKCMFVGEYLDISPLECTVWFAIFLVHIVVSCLLLIIMEKKKR